MMDVKSLASALDGRFEGDGDFEIHKASEPRFAGARDVAVAASPEFIEMISQGAARVAILPEGVDGAALGLDAVIYVKAARRTIVNLTTALEIPWQIPQNGRIDETARIAPSAKIHETAEIGAFSIIGAHVEIGAHVRIRDHVTIAQGAQIDENCLIYSGVRIGPETKIAKNAIVQMNTVVGADGFSYLTPNAEAIARAKSEGKVGELSDLKIERINSLAPVEIAENVEIGANCTIDRGTLRPTKIGAGTKIDNLVHIAHNVEIGENCLICGQVGIAGSSIIGARTILGGQVGVADHIRVGSDVIAAGKSALSSSVPSGQIVMGSPAMKMDANIESYKLYRRLPKLAARVKELETLVSNMLRREE